MLGLCLVAVFALAAVAAAGSASAAEPEWGHCIVSKKAVYANSNCTEVAMKKGKPSHKGAYEWLGGAETCYPSKKAVYANSNCTEVAMKKGKPSHKGSYEKTGGGGFTAASTGPGVLKTAFHVCASSKFPHEQERHPRAECEEYYENGIGEVECKTENATGEAAGTDEIANVSVRFTGCTALGVIPVSSAGLEEGEIETSKLKGRLGYINKGAHEVGVLLEPVTKGAQFTSFRIDLGEELPIEFAVGVGNSTEGAFYTPEATGGYDGVISPITPVNHMTHTFTQDYRVNVVGEERVENVPNKFDEVGAHVELLEAYEANWLEGYSGAWSGAGQELTNVNTLTEGEAEIKA